MQMTGLQFKRKCLLLKLPCLSDFISFVNLLYVHVQIYIYIFGPKKTDWKHPTHFNTIFRGNCFNLCH